MTAMGIPAKAKQLAVLVFEEKQGFLVVTFRAPLVAAGAAGASRSESGD